MEEEDTEAEVIVDRRGLELRRSSLEEDWSLSGCRWKKMKLESRSSLMEEEDTGV